MFFEYKVKTQVGQTITGRIEAVSEESAVTTLTEQGLILLSLKEIKQKMRVFDPFFSRIKAQDILIFARQLSVLVSAGLSLVRALETLSKQAVNREFKKICSEMAADIRGGLRLSSALAKYPHIFDNFYLNMVRVGETAGKLDEILNYLADEQEKNYDLKSKIKGAMVYPAFIIGAVIVIGALMMIFVMPKMLEVLIETGTPLPLATRILISVSKFFQFYWHIIVLVVVGLFILLRLFIKTPTGRRIFDRLKLRSPIFGKLFEKIYLVRFSRSLSTLIIGGVPVASALKIVAEVIGNVIYKNLILWAAKLVEDGEPIASAFLKSGEMPEMVAQMVNVGEQTGRLDVVLDKLANFYAREIENLLNRLTVLIEPIVIIILGIGVFILVAAVILPMYNLAAGIQ